MSLRKRGRWAHVALGPERYESLEDGSVAIRREHDPRLCKACAIERADEIDGQGTWEWPRSRLGVNPDRHTRIRQKHFHNAWPALWGWSTDLGLDGDALIRALQVVSSMEDCIEAFDACDWGTR